MEVAAEVAALEVAIGETIDEIAELRAALARVHAARLRLSCTFEITAPMV